LKARPIDVGPSEIAESFARNFPALYLRFHRRDEKHSQLPTASRSVLQHLALSGPVTVGELCDHLERAQSVVSEIVAHLESQGLLERQDDPDDRRRRLVWLSAVGHDFLRRDQEVLSVDLLQAAVAEMAPTDREALERGVQALLAADDLRRGPPNIPTHRKPTRKDRT
jgi:DNA-binding MarR family transcriptional regulator